MNDFKCFISNLNSKLICYFTVVNQQYVVEVYDEFVPPGSTAVLRCHIPGFMEEYVTVTTWREELTGKVIQPMTSLGENLNFRKKK